jgi:hypothetical protein
VISISGKAEFVDRADGYKMKTFDPPEHIIFGPGFPRIQNANEGSRQYAFSTTNYNLFLKQSDLDDNGTFTISSLLKTEKNCPYCLRWTSVTLPECELTCKTCSLLTRECDGTQARDDVMLSDWLNLKRAYIHEAPRIYRCKLLSTLLNCTTTSAQRRFAEAYYQLAISWVALSDATIARLRDERKIYGSFPNSWSEATENQKVVREILHSLEMPAMIPQVWICCVHETPERLELEEKEWGCVDFLFIYRNKQHVVEIYPSLRRTGRIFDGNIAAAKERLGSRLHLGQYLLNRGYELHRFSEREIFEANEWELPDLMSETLGISLCSIKPEMPSQGWPQNANVSMR